jgi:hypothetical protein
MQYLSGQGCWLEKILFIMFDWSTLNTYKNRLLHSINILEAYTQRKVRIAKQEDTSPAAALLR